MGRISDLKTKSATREKVCNMDTNNTNIKERKSAPPKDMLSVAVPITGQNSGMETDCSACTTVSCPVCDGKLDISKYDKSGEIRRSWLRNYVSHSQVVQLLRIHCQSFHSNDMIWCIIPKQDLETKNNRVQQKPKVAHATPLIPVDEVNSQLSSHPGYARAAKVQPKVLARMKTTEASLSGLVSFAFSRASHSVLAALNEENTQVTLDWCAMRAMVLYGLGVAESTISLRWKEYFNKRMTLCFPGGQPLSFVAETDETKLLQKQLKDRAIQYVRSLAYALSVVACTSRMTKWDETSQKHRGNTILQFFVEANCHRSLQILFDSEHIRKTTDPYE